jgi:hypothetical protein
MAAYGFSCELCDSFRSLLITDSALQGVLSVQTLVLLVSWNDTEIGKLCKYRIFLNLIRTPFLPPCIVRTARTPAQSFGQTPALDHESNPHLPF